MSFKDTTDLAHLAQALRGLVTAISVVRSPCDLSVDLITTSRDELSKVLETWGYKQFAAVSLNPAPENAIKDGDAEQPARSKVANDKTPQASPTQAAARG